MTYAVADGLECHLSNEYNNGRMFKLLLKLDHVCDDNQEDMGDRYMLKLFRQYLFRQVNETGTQLVDIGHVVYSLNRLDIGDESQLLLASPDESTVLVVTFNDIKMCLENAFAEFATTTDVNNLLFLFYFLFFLFLQSPKLYVFIYILICFFSCTERWI